MANKNFDGAPAYVDNSVVSMSNGIWDVELYKARSGDFQVRFTKGHFSSFGSMTESGLFTMFITGAGTVPDYVLKLAQRMYHENVPA